MDQDRLRVLSLSVLLQILQHVVLEVSTRMMEADGTGPPAFVPRGCGGSSAGSNSGGEFGDVEVELDVEVDSDVEVELDLEVELQP